MPLAACTATSHHLSGCCSLWLNPRLPSHLLLLRMAGRPRAGAVGPWTGSNPLPMPSDAWEPVTVASSRAEPSSRLPLASAHVPHVAWNPHGGGTAASAEARRLLKRGAQHLDGGESMETDLAEGQRKRTSPNASGFVLMQPKTKEMAKPPPANPRLRPQQGALPRWLCRPSWNDNCRCRRVEGQDAGSSATGLEEPWPHAVGSVLKEPRYTNRCRYLWRRGGCKLGANCDL